MHPAVGHPAYVAHFGADGAVERAAEADRAFAGVRAEVGDLSAMPPGPDLAAGLLAAQTAAMDTATAIDVVACWERLRSWVDAQHLAALAAAAGTPDAESDAWVVADVAATTHTSEHHAGSRLALARRVGDNLPQTWEALQAGDLTLAHLQAMDGPTQLLSAPLAQRVESGVLPRALRHGWTPGELRDAARREALRADPQGAKERARRARVRDSDVTLYPREDETGALVAVGDAWTTRQMMDEVNRRADVLKRGGDTRRLGEVRMAVLAELVLAGATPTAATGGAASVPGPRVGSRRAQALVFLDLPTLLGLRDDPGELAGHGPVTAAMARMIAADATLRLLVLGPTGRPESLGQRSYVLSRQMRRFLEARDRECLFPGCRRRAVYCDADHCEEFDRGGTTSCDNCGLLCRRHHTMKTSKAWRCVRHDDDSVTWTSPFGHTFRVRPRPYDWDPATLDEPPEWDVPVDDPLSVDTVVGDDPDPPDAGAPDPDPPPPADDDEAEHDWWNRFFLRAAS